MKVLLATCLLVFSSFIWAAENPAPASPPTAIVKGEVLEVKDVESYTYLLLKTREGETWAAVDKATVKKGDEVTLENVTVMNNFESKSLKKTFPTILFGTLGGAGTVAPAGHVPGSSYPATAASKPEAVKDEHIDKASGANSQTVADVMTRSAKLKHKPVLVRGKVVKYNPGIMGKNWVHLRDGSGSAADGSNDLLVTTMSTTKVGDVVTAKGIVSTDRDFGAGYAYKVVVEEATLQ